MGQSLETHANKQYNCCTSYMHACFIVNKLYCKQTFIIFIIVYSLLYLVYIMYYGLAVASPCRDDQKQDGGSNQCISNWDHVTVNICWTLEPPAICNN